MHRTLNFHVFQSHIYHLLLIQRVLKLTTRAFCMFRWLAAWFCSSFLKKHQPFVIERSLALTALRYRRSASWPIIVFSSEMKSIVVSFSRNFRQKPNSNRHKWNVERSNIFGCLFIDIFDLQETNCSLFFYCKLLSRNL